jgi:oligoribonuclease
MNTPAKPYLVWFDTEYTSLELDQACLLQVAMIVTDAEGRRLAPAARDLATVVRLPDGVPVSDFLQRECPELVREARSVAAPAVGDVDRLLAGWLDELAGPPAQKVADRPILAGNSIHADWWLARRFLPRFLARLHYRHLDVSALKIIWLASGMGAEFKKEDSDVIRAHLPGWEVPAGTRRHDALYDVMASIAELNYYRRHLLRAKSAQNSRVPDLVKPAQPES